MTYKLISFLGIPRVGDIIEVFISDSNGNNKNVSYEVVAGNSIASIVNSLFDLIIDSNFIPVIYNNDSFYVYSPNNYTVATTANIILSSPKQIDAYTWSFNEKRNAYCSFYSYHPEWITSAEDVIYSWLNGQLWVHNNTEQYCNFYGQQYNVSITLVFNINLLEKKTWLTVEEIASAIWRCPVVYTNVISHGNQRQESFISEAMFKTLESNFHASFRRDVNSRKGLINGDFLKGNWVVVKFLKENASDLVILSEVIVGFVDSPLTNR